MQFKPGLFEGQLYFYNFTFLHLCSQSIQISKNMRFVNWEDIPIFLYGQTVVSTPFTTLIHFFSTLLNYDFFHDFFNVLNSHWSSCLQKCQSHTLFPFQSHWYFTCDKTICLIIPLLQRFSRQILFILSCSRILEFTFQLSLGLT